MHFEVQKIIISFQKKSTFFLLGISSHQHREPLTAHRILPFTMKFNQSPGNHTGTSVDSILLKNLFL